MWYINRGQIKLLDLDASQKIKKYDEFFSIRVAYQCPLKIEINGAQEEALPYTFEDALVFDNLTLFKGLDGKGLIGKFKEILNTKKNIKDIGKDMFDTLRKGDKAKFGLDLLFLKDPEELKVPTYIEEGFSWLQSQLDIKQKDILLPVADSQGERTNAK